jgi:hypothetical protein
LAQVEPLKVLLLLPEMMVATRLSTQSLLAVAVEAELMELLTE